MTTSPLPPFSGRNTSCPKCGMSVDVAWHLLGLQKGFPCWNDPPDCDEHMCRVCPECGYGWMEAPADANAAEVSRALRGLP